MPVTENGGLKRLDFNYSSYITHSRRRPSYGVYYDKRDDFEFDIVNFPFLDGDVPRRPSYGVYT